MPLPFIVKENGTAGSGLFAGSDIRAEAVIHQDERPLLAVLDSQHLKTACAWCFQYSGESDEGLKLNVCMGCRILRYCGVQCQSAAWKHSHKLECKLYSKLYPAVLPNTARMVMHLLLRRKKLNLAQSEWTSFYRLRHHIEDFKRLGASGNETYQNIQLMSRAAQEYGETGDDLGLVEQVSARILINTLTLTTPLYTPLGLALSLTTSLLNHSCEPNCVISFSGPGLTLRALKPIISGEELTISYIDISFPPEARQNELAGRYFFKCICPACSESTTLGRPEPPPEIASISKPELEKLEESVITHISEAAKATGPIPKGLTHLARALVLFEKYPSFPSWRQPLARVRTDIILQLLGHKHFLAALLQSLIQRYEADPVTVPEDAHPVRVARTWVLAKLMMQMESLSLGTADAWQDEEGNYALGEGSQDVRDLQIKFKIDWQLLTWVLIAEVAEKIERSHGRGTRFDVEVKQAVNDMTTGFQSGGKGLPSKQTVEDCHAKMKRLAREGWDWWKLWERDARKKKPFMPMYREDDSDQDPIGVLTGDHE